jgi:hypothetical protein
MHRYFHNSLHVRIPRNAVSLLLSFSLTNVRFCLTFNLYPKQKSVKTITMALSIWKRKHDLIYLIFFLTHIPIMFCKTITFLDCTAKVYVYAFM